MNQRSPLGYTARLGPAPASSRRGSELPIGWIIGLGSLFAVLLLLFIVGSSATTEAEADPGVASLEEIVKPALTRAGYGDVVVTAEGRTITLAGELATRSDVVAATAVANSIAEVAAVRNQLTFEGELDLVEFDAQAANANVGGGSAASTADLLLQAELAGIAARDPIQFETGSDELTPESAITIANIAGALEGRPQARIEIGGHTDSDGEPDANQLLSEARANAVLGALLAAGVEADRMVAVGYGDIRPVSDNETAEGKRRNRRIEFLVLL